MKVTVRVEEINTNQVRNLEGGGTAKAGHDDHLNQRRWKAMRTAHRLAAKRRNPVNWW